MTNLKTLLSILLLLFIITSCNPTGESYEKFTGYVSITETVLPDSALVGHVVPVYAKATAPNGCWSDLKLYLNKSVSGDTLFGIIATGLYESYNGICTEILITADTTFEFKPDSAGTYIFASYSSALIPHYDTLYVSDTVQGRGPVLK